MVLLCLWYTDSGGHAVIKKNRLSAGIAGFESRLGHGYSSLVSVVCFVGSGLCDGLIIRSEER